MAGRTSTSLGMGIALAALGVGFLASFVLFAVFFGKYNDAKNALERNNQESKDIIAGERNSDTIRALVETSKKEHKSLVAYLADMNAALMSRVTGNPRDTMDVIGARLKGVAGSDQPILSMIENQGKEISGLRAAKDQAESASKRAMADLTNEVGRVKIVEDSHKKTITELNAQIGAYKDEVDNYRKQVDVLASNASKQMEGVRTGAEESEKKLQDQVQKLTEQRLVLEAQLASLRGQQNKLGFRGKDEASLVDGRIVGTNDADRSVVVNIGRQQKAVLGMTFAVFANPEAIRPDESGVYPEGKATLEITNVGDNSSTCRVTSELRGNPVVRGDVIANALFDPNKVYKFVVFGNFDTNRDGLTSPIERSEMENMIKGWGGEVAPDMSGNADFLVLGERPVLPPRPDANAPLEVVLEFNRRFREVEKYDALFKQAGSTGIPVLNENRLYTLTGKTPAARRAAR